MRIDLRVVRVDVFKKPGWVILTYVDGSVEEFEIDDKEFLASRFNISLQRESK